VHELVALLRDPARRHVSFDDAVRDRDAAWRAAGRDALEAFAASAEVSLARVRALLFGAALHGEEADADRAEALRRRAFAALGAQVRDALRADPEHAPLFAWRDPARHPGRLGPSLLAPRAPGLVARTPVRADFPHSGGSDLFALTLDDPQRARVVNASLALAPRGGTPRPPVEAHLRVIGSPVLRLESTDLDARTELSRVGEVFDFRADRLALLRAATVAGGIVPAGLEEAADAPLAPLLADLVGPGRGLALATRVHDVPEGSRLGVSTALLACAIAVCQRALGEARPLEGPLDEASRRRVAARAVLGEWLGGSGGGWQDSGGLWPGVKRIEARAGALLPEHRPIGASPALREILEERLVLVHGGLARDIGPVLERVSEDHLLRREPAWSARREAAALYDTIVDALARGDADALARATDRNFHGPLCTILPEARNAFTEALIARVRGALGDAYRGFWMLGGTSGGGMGFWVAPGRRAEAVDRIAAALDTAQADVRDRFDLQPPLVYDLSLDETGSAAERG